MIGKVYDHIVIDGPPRITESTCSVIMASDMILISVQPSPFEIWATDAVVKLINEARKSKEIGIAVFTISRKITDTAMCR